MLRLTFFAGYLASKPPRGFIVGQQLSPMFVVLPAFMRHGQLDIQPHSSN